MSKKHPPIAAHKRSISNQIVAAHFTNSKPKKPTIIDDIETAESTAPTRAFVVQCRKCGVPNSCGFQVSNIKDIARTGTFSAEIVVLLVCRACGYAIDRCDLHVMVSGIGSWQVLKKHVG